MKPITLTIKTLPVGINASYKSGKGHFYKSKYAKIAQEAMAWEIRSQYRGKPLEGHVGLNIDLILSTDRKDIDGPIKSIMDAMQGIIYENDNQVKDLHLTKSTDRTNPRIEITVFMLD